MALLEILANPFVVAVGTAIASGLVSWRALKYREGRLREDLSTLRSGTLQKQSRIEELERTLRESRNDVAIPMAKKSEIISTLNDLLDHSQAERASFYVPVHNLQSEFLGLVVLATAPSDLSSQAFIGTVFSGRDSKAVECFLTGGVVESDTTSYSIDGYSPNSTYANCLQTSAITGKGEKVAVVQLLSSSGKKINLDKAARAIEEFRSRLVELGSAFSGENERLIDLTDVKVPRESRRGTVLSMDISNSSALFFDEARSFITLKLMGEIIRESVSEINRNNGIFESFTGDGFIAAFSGGARDSSNNPAERALTCALAIHEKFQELLLIYRTDLAHLKADLSLRFGLVTGTIHPIMLSFGQLRTSSVVGRTPSRAKRLCDLGSRDQTAINIDSSTFHELTTASQAHFGERARTDGPEATDQVFGYKDQALALRR